MKYTVYFLFFIFICSVVPINAEEIDFPNWENHPQIKEIMDIIHELEYGRRAGKYSFGEVYDNWDCEEPICYEHKFFINEKQNPYQEFQPSTSFYRACGWTIKDSNNRLEDKTHTKKYFDQNRRMRLYIYQHHKDRQEITEYRYINKEGIAFWLIIRETESDKIIKWNKIDKQMIEDDALCFEKIPLWQFKNTH